MGRKGFVIRTPAEIRAQIERRFAEGALTLDQLREELLEMFPDEAVPSRSALGRYGQKLSRRLDAIKAGTEAARLIAEQAGDSQDARSEALTALVQTELFEAILSLQEVDDPELDQGERVAMLSAAAKNIATLTRSSVNLKKFQAEVEERARRQLLEEQSARADALMKKGVTEETRQAIRGVLGIR
ncbi:MAG: DUF3486 family protein [Azoarcus sp.]|jgi:hypothetical protein|nr:DUF3486 family protein [Azoarcus sp.]